MSLDDDVSATLYLRIIEHESTTLFTAIDRISPHKFTVIQYTIAGIINSHFKYRDEIKQLD